MFITIYLENVLLIKANIDEKMLYIIISLNMSLSNSGQSCYVQR